MEKSLERFYSESVWRSWLFWLYTVAIGLAIARVVQVGLRVHRGEMQLWGLAALLGAVWIRFFIQHHRMAAIQDQAAQREVATVYFTLLTGLIVSVGLVLSLVR